MLDDTSAPQPEQIAAVTEELEACLGALAVAAPDATPPGVAERVLGVLDDVLRNAGHRPFLMSGTLLGVVRQGRLLAHDYDLDLGLLPGDGTATAVAGTLRGHGAFTVTVEEGRVWGRHADGVAFDVFLHHAAEGKFWHDTGAHTWWNTPFELAPIELSGRLFWAPDDTDLYLTENYGDWSRPVAFFDKNLDTPNLRWRPTVEALYYLHDLVVDAAGDRRDRAAAEVAIAALRDTFGIELGHHLGSRPNRSPGNDDSTALD